MVGRPLIKLKIHQQQLNRDLVWICRGFVGQYPTESSAVIARLHEVVSLDYPPTMTFGAKA